MSSLKALGAVAAVVLACPAMAIAESKDVRKGAAAITVVGSNVPKERCMQAARAGAADQRFVDACSEALNAKLTDKERADILVNRGVLRARLKAFADALPDFDAAVALRPEHAEALLNKGVTLVQTKAFADAVPILTRAMTLGVKEPYKAYYNRGAAREALGDARGAYEDYTTALQIRPDWGPAEAEIARFVRGRRDQLAARLNTEAAAN